MLACLELTDRWPPGRRAVAALVGGEVVGITGAWTGPMRWASITKLVTALAVHIAADEGRLPLDDPAGPPGATIRHLLSHTSGMGLEWQDSRAAPGTRRIYSNAGYELLGTAVATATAVDFD